MKLIIEYSKIEQRDEIIYCKYSDDEEIAKAITFGNYKKIKKEEYHILKDDIFKDEIVEIKNDDRLYLDTINNICFQVRGVVSDVHNNVIPNAYYFRNIGSVVEEHETLILPS